MSRYKPYKHHKRSTEKFLKFEHWFLNCEAWKRLTPNARVLYMELKMRFNGSNNGQIFLSHRDASQRMNVTRPTVAKAFKELETFGFIKITQGYCLGSNGRGQANHYALTELSVIDQPATKEFMCFEKKL